MPFYGYNRPGAKISEGQRESFRLQGLMGGIKGQLDCIHEFSEVDYTEDLKRIDIPVLVAHGDDDQIVPIKAAALKSVKLLKQGVLQSVRRRRSRLCRHQYGRVQRRCLELHPRPQGGRRRLSHPPVSDGTYAASVRCV